MDPKKRTQTLVETRTVPQTRPATTLTRDEELVLRMRRGWSEGADHVLEFRGASNPELEARLGLIEAHFLADIYELGPFAHQPELDWEVRDLIVSKLGTLKD